jgi:hypothetical protein
MRFMGAIWESVHNPASWGVMRPLGRTDVASIIVGECGKVDEVEVC